MLAFDFLGAAFADGVLFRVKMTRVGAPLIGVVVGQAEGIEQRLELEEHLIFTAAKDIREHLSRLMIDGMPEPARIAFPGHETPHFIHLGFTRALNVYRHLLWVQRAQQRRVDRLQRRFLLLEFTEDGVGTDVQRPRPYGGKSRLIIHS